MLDLEIRCSVADWRSGVEIRARAKTGGSFSYMRPCTMDVVVEDGLYLEPAMVIGMDSAQPLMDELWNCGLRPTEWSGSAGSLAATQRHLEDMRTLVFKPSPTKEQSVRSKLSKLEVFDEMQDSSRTDVISDLSDEAMARDIGLYDWGIWLRKTETDGKPKTSVPCTSKFRAGYRLTAAQETEVITKPIEQLEKLDRAIAALEKNLKGVILGLYLFNISLNRLGPTLGTTRHHVIIRRNRALIILYSAYQAGLLKSA